ncbi:MAG: hypothetical protein ACE5F1_03140 [Planctomycetota bacterium]
MTGTRTLTGILFLVPGLLIAWLCMSLESESALRGKLEKRVLELVGELEQSEHRNDELASHQAELEGRMLESETTRSRTLEAISEIRKRFLASRPAEVAAPEPEKLKRRILEEQAFRRGINKGLMNAGISRLRFQRIGAREEAELGDVRLLGFDEEGLLEGVYLAKRCVFELDRSKGKLAISLAGVVQFIGEKRFAVETHTIELEPEKPRALEESLGSYLKTSGEYPVERESPGSSELEVLEVWRERLVTFLERAAQDTRYELQRIRRVENGGFSDVELLGYTKTGRLTSRIKARRMEVWIDTDRERVELRFHDGFIDISSGRMRFPGRWYTLPMANAKRRDTERLLTGFVHSYGSFPKGR